MVTFRLIAILAVVAIIFVLATYFLHFFFKKNRFIKYIPSILSLIFSISNFYLARYDGGSGFEDIARMLLAIFLFIGFSAGLICGLIIDYINKRRNFN